VSLPEFPLYIEQGASFDSTLNWYGGGQFIAPIEHLEEGYPTIFTVTAHLLNAVSPTPVIVSGVQDLDHVNSEDTEIHLATRIDANNFSMPVTSVGETWEPGTGEITYWKPTDITGWGGECNIRKNWHSDIIHTISTVLGTMVLDGTDGSIQLLADPEETKLFVFVGAVYDIDLWPGGGARPDDGSAITRVFRGPITLAVDI
jgi:hypothetical protein